LTADSASFEKGLDRANAAMRRAAAQGEATGKVIAAQISRLAGIAAAYLGASRAVDTFTKAIEDVTALGRLSQQSGIAVERLSELRFAAASVGVTFEELQQTIRGFAQRMAEGLTDNASSVSIALNTLGVSARNADGSLRNFDQILPDLADGFSRYADGAGEAQLASALFGEGRARSC
jgi:hypothetical protein